MCASVRENKEKSSHFLQTSKTLEEILNIQPRIDLLKTFLRFPPSLNK